MTRNKGAAPAPPVRPKPCVKFSNSANANAGNSKAATGSSLVFLFDELTRNSRVLREGGCDGQFKQVAANQGLCRKRWHAAEGELLRMRTELERCEGEVRKLELKLEQARDLLSTETSQRKKAEQERDMMGQKWDIVRELGLQARQIVNRCSQGRVHVRGEREGQVRPRRQAAENPHPLVLASYKQLVLDGFPKFWRRKLPATFGLRRDCRSASRGDQVASRA